jgi:hypothetical protein
MNALRCFGCFLAVSVVMAHSACVPIPGHYTKHELVGSYEIDYPFGSDILILREDDTYEQRFTDKSGKISTNKGKWTLIPERDNQVQLENAVLVCDPFGKFASATPQQGLAYFSAGWYRGTVLTVSEDLGLYMRKLR